MSDIYTENRTGLRTESYGTPDTGLDFYDFLPFTNIWRIPPGKKTNNHPILPCERLFHGLVALVKSFREV